MRQTHPTRHRLRHLSLLAAAVIALLSVRGTAQLDPPRNLTGTVTDRGKEPLKGAIVEVENESTSAIISYITDASGAFSFKRLSSNTDYRVSVTYRGHHARPRELSHFDTKANAVIHFIIPLP